MREVIVVGRNYATDLSVIRSLGMAGYTVKLASTDSVSLSIASKSKYVMDSLRAELNSDSIFRAMEKLRGDADQRQGL